MSEQLPGTIVPEPAAHTATTISRVFAIAVLALEPTAPSHLHEVSNWIDSYPPRRASTSPPSASPPADPSAS